MIHQLIKNLYEPHSELPDDEYFYREVLKELKTDPVFSQLYFLLNKQNKLAKTPFFFQKELKKQYQSALYQNVFIKKQTDTVLQAFESLEIETIPLKGVYFAEKYFGHTGARGTSDIDLLIKEKDIAKAVEAVKQLGFTLEEEPIPQHFHTSLSKAIPGSPYPLTLEIHWSILKSTTSSFEVEEFWNEAAVLAPYQHIKLLSDEDTFYMICLHGWRHNLDSSKYFLDIMQLIYLLKGRLHYGNLWGKAERHQTLKRLKRTLAIVYQEYPMLHEIEPLVIEEKWKKKYQESRKKTGLRSYIEFVDYQFFSYDSLRHSWNEFVGWLAPSKADVWSQLKQKPHKESYVSLLSFLYKQRCQSAAKAMGSIFRSGTLM